MFVYCHPRQLRSCRSCAYNDGRSGEPEVAFQRTLFGIVWGCLSTIIICAWTSAHPNVPPANQWKARWNRLKLMFWMIFAPELVLAWAVRQFFGAKMIRDAYNERYPELNCPRKWTLVHGYLLEMGGFTLIDPAHKYAEHNRTVFSFDHFNEHPNIEIPEISAAEIEDRSKGDGLLKIIAILQTIWFIVQCIARGQQGLALTELELVALAIASLNAVTYAIWWHKPLGVQEPVKIYFKIDAPKVEDAVRQEELQNISVGHVIRASLNELTGFSEFLQNPCKYGPFGFFIIFVAFLPIWIAYTILLPFLVLFPLGTVFLLSIIKTDAVLQNPSRSRCLIAAQIVASLQRFRCQLTSVVSKFVGDSLKDIYTSFNASILRFVFSSFILLPLLFLFLCLFTIFFMPFFALVFLVSFIFTDVFGIVTATSISPGASHVPSFYAPRTESDRWSRMLAFALFGVIFGGLLCIGWNFKFPTHVEQILWRTTTTAIAAIPLIVAPINLILVTRLGTRDVKSCGNVERVTLLTLDLVMTILLFIYVPVRLSLIAQALALLRSQSPSVLAAVDWTKYLPHLSS